MTAKQPNPLGRLRRHMKQQPKQLFWAWVAYQAVKGITTASLIWAPLIYMWFSHH